MSDKSREELEERVDELEDTVKKMLPSRRQVLKGSATAAGAGMLGFSAGNASAQASESDSDGNVGTPDNRVDVFGDGIDAAELQNHTDILVFGPSGGLIHRIDITSSTTPVQDAMELIHNQSATAGGKVVLPSLTIENAGQVYQYDGVDVYGTGKSRVTVTGNPSELWVIEGGSVELENVVIAGEGVASTQADGLVLCDSISLTNARIDRIWIKDIQGRAVVGSLDGSNVPYASEIGSVRVDNVDAGNETALFDFTYAGPSLKVGVLHGYPVHSVSGSDSTFVHAGGTDIQIEELNAGMALAELVTHQKGGLQVEHWNYEPLDGQQAAGPYDVFDITAQYGFGVTIGSGQVTVGDVDHVFNLQDGAGNIQMDKPHFAGGATATSNIGNIVNTLSTPLNYYYGPASDWDGGSANLRYVADQIIDSGSQSVTFPGASADDTWGSFQTTTTSVTFNKTFASAPNVTLGQVSKGGVILSVANLTETGFDIRAINYSTTDHSASTDNVSWIARG